MAEEQLKVHFDTKRFEAFIKDKWGPNRKCPYCGEGKWSISATCGELDELTLEEGQSAKKYLPVVPVTCENCGNTVLVHPAKSGAVQKPGVKEAKHAG